MARADYRLLMHGRVNIESDYTDQLTFVDSQRPFESISEYFGYPLGKHQRRRSKVARKELRLRDGETLVVYFKLYGYRRLRRALSRVFKPTRSQREIANLKFFHSIGIPACEPVLQGVYRNLFGIARNCMLITREVEGTRQLNDFMAELNGSSESEALKTEIRKRILEALADNLAKIHERGFYHDDFKWRNILVRRCDSSGPEVETFWIDCPNGYFDRLGGVRGRHGKIKDLATADYDARKLISSEDREFFLSRYSGLEAGSAELSALKEEVTAYRKLKIDDDRPGRR